MPRSIIRKAHRRAGITDNGVVRKLQNDGVTAPRPLEVLGAPKLAAGARAKTGKVGLGPASQLQQTPRVFSGEVPNSITAASVGAKRGFEPRTGAPLKTASALEKLFPPGTAALALPFLGHDGVLGADSALGIKGPLGNHLHNPSWWMKAIGPWNQTAELLTALGGPGSAASPVGELGANGSWSKQHLEGLFGSFGKALAPDGDLAVLGRGGPLFWALTFTSSVGGTGYVLNDQGRFVDESGKTRRGTTIEYQGRPKKYALYESYPEATAARMSSNDTSWMVRGQLDHRDPDGDLFHFTAKAGQPFNLVATPERPGERYGIELLDGNGKVLQRSDSSLLVNWVREVFPEDTKLSARVFRLDDAATFRPVGTLTDLWLAPMIAMGQAFAPFARAAGFQVDTLEPDHYRLYNSSAQ